MISKAYRIINPLISREELLLPYYVTSCSAFTNQRGNVLLPQFPDYMWLHTVKGSGVVVFDGNPATVSESMGFLAFPGKACEYYPVREPWETRWFTFNGCGVPQLMKALSIESSSVFNILNLQPLEALFEDIYLGTQYDEALRGYECSAMLYSFFMKLKSCLSESSSPDTQRFKTLLSYIQENIHMNLTLEDMSTITNMSTYHFCHLFKKTFGSSPFEYIIKLRINKAKELLLGCEKLSIKEIAQKSGFKHTSYFCKVFKEFEKMPPDQFRRLHNKNI